MSTTIIKTGDLNVVAKACLCGCGRPVTSKVNYRPGHDARHVSALVNKAAQHSFADSIVTPLVTLLPTESLKVKFIAAVDRAAAKDSKRQARPQRRTTEQRKVDKLLAESPVEEDTKPWPPKPLSTNATSVKVGRWSYPTNPNDPTFRNTKRDGSGEWVKIDGSDTLV